MSTSNLAPDTLDEFDSSTAPKKSLNYTTPAETPNNSNQPSIFQKKNSTKNYKEQPKFPNYNKNNITAFLDIGKRIK